MTRGLAFRMAANRLRAFFNAVMPILMMVVLFMPPVVLGVSVGDEDGVWTGFMLGLAALGVAAFAYRPGFWTFILVAFLLAAVALTPPAHCAAREVPHERWRCSLRLGNIVCGLWNYRQKYGCYPPACLRDKNGKPMHSWRVLILPYLDGDKYDALYRQYDFNEPWDGPHNRKLLASCPLEYRCRDALPHRGHEQTTTSYVAVVGSNAAWTGSGARISDKELSGKKANTTVVLIEVPAAAGIQWTEPRDLSLDALQDPPSPVAPVVHERADRGNPFYYYDVVGPPYVSVAFIDGTRQSLFKEDLTAERLHTLLSVGGCTEADCDPSRSVEKGELILRIRWLNCMAAAVWCISAGVVVSWAAITGRRRRRQRTAC
jgi:hypothetical protein